MINRLTDSLDFHAQALVLRSERQRVIASNIANADTPGYKARDFDFANALRAATGASSSGRAGIGGGIGSDIARNVASSLGGASGTSGSTLSPRLRYAVPGQTHLDNNTVDMDRERAAFMDNAVNYESTLRFVNSSVRTMLEAMRSPNQG
jgi:flagellar basal-body rod protein FlgB